MKKTLLRLYKWIIISVMLQVLILVFFNNFYLADRKVQVDAKPHESFEFKPKPKVDWKLPEGIEQIRVSYDGAYASYLHNGKLEILSIKDEKVVKTIDPDSSTLTYYRWLPDRRMIIYAKKLLDSQYGHIEISTIDVDSGTESSYPKMSKLVRESEVVGIELSPLTKVAYVKVKTSQNQASIYKYNIMNNLSYIMTASINTVIKQAGYADKLIYQDEKFKAYVRDGGKNVTWPFPFKKKMALIGIDPEDQVYLGELDNSGKVSRLHYGKLTVEPDKAWYQISLKNQAFADELVVAPDEAAYYVPKGDKFIINTKTNKKTDYTGEFIEIIKGYVVSLSSGKLIFTEIK
ncbi:MAG: hypothetical protein N2489_05935 [Clostridia bacterium]|nr:hypothetical protein [Clostridia bacterium]